MPRIECSVFLSFLPNIKWTFRSSLAKSHPWKQISVQRWKKTPNYRTRCRPKRLSSFRPCVKMKTRCQSLKAFFFYWRKWWN